MTEKISALVPSKVATILALITNCATFSFKKNGAEKSANKYTFQDISGNIEYVDWDCSAGLPVGMVCEISCMVGEYNGKKNIAKVLGHVRKPELDASICSKHSIVPMVELYDKFNKYMLLIKDPFISYVAAEMLGAHEQLFMTAPAAKYMHNACVHGLVEHSVQMATMGRYAHRQYKRYFPQLSLDKILFGCLFHDWGKMFEYDTTNPSYPITKQGHLTPHIVRGIAEVYRIGVSAIETKLFACDELSILIDNAPTGLATDYMKDTLDELMHIMASHHGKEEYGSPVVPKTIEALIVHNLDMLDGKVMHAYMMMETPANMSAVTPEMTEKSFVENISFLRQEIKTNA